MDNDDGDLINQIEDEKKESEDDDDGSGTPSESEFSPSPPFDESGSGLDPGKRKYLKSKNPTPQSVSSVWQYFVPIHDAATGACITATCTKCLISLNPKLGSLEEHLLKSPSCGSVPPRNGQENGKTSNPTACFICGKTRQNGKVGSAKFEAFREYPFSWAQDIGDSVCKVLALGGGGDDEGTELDYFLPTILGTGLYCSFCAQALRDMHWMLRTTESLTSKLASLRATVVNRIGIGLGHKSGDWDPLEEDWDKPAFIQNLKNLHAAQVEHGGEETEEVEDGEPDGIGLKYLPTPAKASSDEDFHVDEEGEESDSESISSEDSDLPGKERRRRPNAKKAKKLKLGCPLGCQRYFRTAENLNLHVRGFHNKEKDPYHCLFPSCGTKFDILAKLTRHQREKRHGEEDVRKGMTTATAGKSNSESHSHRHSNTAAQMHYGTPSSSKSLKRPRQSYPDPTWSRAKMKTAKMIPELLVESQADEVIDLSSDSEDQDEDRTTLWPPGELVRMRTEEEEILSPFRRYDGY